MKPEIQRAIHNYAIAFLSVYDQQITQHDIQMINKAQHILMRRRSALLLLDRIAAYAHQVPEEVNRLCDYLELPSYCKSLVELLIDHERAILLPDVLQAIFSEWNKIHNIYYVTVRSSPALTQIQQSTLTRLITRRLERVANIEFIHDPSLIMGLVIDSRDMRWEYSYAAVLRRLQTALLQ